MGLNVSSVRRSGGALSALALAVCAACSTVPSPPPPAAPLAPAPAAVPGGDGPLAAAEVAGATWTRARTRVLWSGRDGHAGLVWQDRLWVFGGWGTGPLRDVWSSADGLDWTQVTEAAPWAARKAFGAAVFRDRLWVLGGSLGAEQAADVWSSPDGRQWERVLETAPWGARTNHAVAVFGDRLWVLGGWSPDGHRDLADVWSSPDGVTWSRARDAAWTPRNGHSAVVHDGRLWVLAGWGRQSDGGEGNLQDVWSTRDGATWQQATGRAGWTPRNHQAALATDGADGRLWVLGGWGLRGDGQEGNLNDVWWSTDDAAWRPATGQAGWLPRNGHAAVVFGGRLWILGGWSHFIGGSSINDLWTAAVAHP
jgi:hypothetical protein